MVANELAATVAVAISTREVHEIICHNVVWSDILHRKNVRLRCALGCKLAAKRLDLASSGCWDKQIIEACEFVCLNSVAAHSSGQQPSSCRQACDQTKHRSGLANQCFAKQSTKTERDCRQDADCKLQEQSCCRCGLVWRHAINKTATPPPCETRSCPTCPPGKVVHLGTRVKCIKPELRKPGSVPESERTGQCTAYY